MADPSPAVDTRERTPDEGAAVEPEPLVESELLVEDVSIDGMCGVY